MKDLQKTLLIRHRRENLKKCSLRGLEQNKDFEFCNYPFREIPSLSNKIVLTVDAPPLTYEDRNKGIVLLDATWRLAIKMEKALSLDPAQRRSLPGGFQTAYPRRQTDCPFPEIGLASIEALFVAFFLLKRDTQSLLDNYYWKEDFLCKNSFLL